MMRISTFAGACAAMAALAGCVETGPLPIAPLPGGPPPIAIEPPLGDDTCGIGPARVMIGLDSAAAVALPRRGPVRVIGPDQPVTMDFNPERLNVYTNAAGRIERVTCG